MEEVVLEMGFNSVKEFNQMISNVDLSSQERLNAFKNWQNLDGTKEGLLKLP